MVTASYKRSLAMALATVLGFFFPATGFASDAQVGEGRSGDAADFVVAAAVEGGLGGTGRSDAESGLGGTGRSGGESGMGGTGRSGGESGIGGTGFIGTITGLGSILVNGSKIEYAQDVAVTIDGRAGSAEALARDQLVAVEAAYDGERWTANSIAIRHEVSGPISAVDADAGRLVVLGQTVVFASASGTDATTWPGADEYAEGQWVKVSGLRRSGGEILASRLDSRDADGPVRVVGRADVAEGGAVMIGALRIDGGDTETNSLIGLNVVAEGEFIDGVLYAERLEPVAQDPFDGRVERLSLEGFVTGQRATGAVTVAGWEVNVAPGLQVAGIATDGLRPDLRVMVEGRMSGGRVVAAEAIRIVPERPTLHLERPQGAVQPAGQKGGHAGHDPAAASAGKEPPGGKPPPPGAGKKPQPPVAGNTPRPPAHGGPPPRPPRPPAIGRPPQPPPPHRPPRPPPHPPPHPPGPR